MAEQMKGKIEELPLPRLKEREIVARVRTDTQQQNSLDKQQQQQIVAVWDKESTCIYPHHAVQFIIMYGWKFLDKNFTQPA